MNKTLKWQVVDPLAEKAVKITPNHYVSNNPITRIEPDAREDGEYEKDENGEWQKFSHKGDALGLNFYHNKATNNKKGKITQLQQ